MRFESTRDATHAGTLGSGRPARPGAGRRLVRARAAPRRGYGRPRRCASPARAGGTPAVALRRGRRPGVRASRRGGGCLRFRGAGGRPHLGGGAALGARALPRPDRRIQGFRRALPGRDARAPATGCGAALHDAGGDLRRHRRRSRRRHSTAVPGSTWSCFIRAATCQRANGSSSPAGAAT